MVAYFFKFLKGDFTSGMNTDDTAAAFGNMLADPKQMAFWMIVTVVLGFLVCSRGLQNGLEKISKFMMTALALAYHCPCGAQYHTFRGFGRSEILSCSKSGCGL